MADYSLSERAKEILSATGENAGEIRIDVFMGKYMVVTNGQSIGEGTPKGDAINKSAIEELERNDLIENFAENSYKLTAGGWTRSGLLRG